MEPKKEQIEEPQQDNQKDEFSVSKLAIVMAMMCVMIITIGMFIVTAATVFVDGNTAQLEVLIKTFGQTLLVLTALLAPSPLAKSK